MLRLSVWGVAAGCTGVYFLSDVVADIYANPGEFFKRGGGGTGVGHI